MTGSIDEYLEGITSEKRRRDARVLLGLMERVTGVKPVMWGSIVGFGRYHYRYASGREGDTPAAGFAARKAATTIYIADGIGAHKDLLTGLGPHTTGVGCLYIKDLGSVDLGVLEEIVGRSYAAVTKDVDTKRARESG